MKKNNLNDALKNGFEKISPDVFKEVLSVCDREEGKVMAHTENKRAFRKTRYVILAAALLVLIGAVIFGIAMAKRDQTPNGAEEENVVPLTEVENTSTAILPTEEPVYQSVATVYFDVNPGICFDVTDTGTVFALRATNADGKAVADNIGEEANGKSLKDAITLIVAHETEKGYISSKNNAVLLSVSSDDGKTGERVCDEAYGEIGASLKKNGVLGGKVVAQLASLSQKVSDFADEYAISVSKAEYIIRLLDFNEEYSAERLASMTVSELVELCKEWNIISWHKIDYSVKEAYEIALADAGVQNEDAELLFRHSQASIPGSYKDWKADATCLWSFWFRSGDDDYGYHINTETGEIFRKVKVNHLPGIDSVEKMAVDYFALLGETATVEILPDSLEIAYKLYFFDYSGTTDVSIMASAKTEKGIYVLSIDSLKKEISVRDFHEWKE